MFCATFYSYKGGVGRTLALANVAAVFARRGKRVLVVDFDLEAPGLTTLNPFNDAADCPGVIDFVQDYLDNSAVPDAGKYIQTCEFFDPQADTMGPMLQIDVMPAGRADGEYAQRFSSIDWGRLYQEQDGFLLMEDLRAQWRKAGYDYVLIDSRTGLTDVGGISTRQLPNAVVAVFFLNEQNLSGLRQVVPAIRTEGARERPIDIIFAASRVPRLDDEHGVLRSWFARFQEELGYGPDELTKIEQYDSLALLDQRLFVLDRPNSGLAHQYEELAASLSALNVEDADGALRFLRAAGDRFRGAQGSVLASSGEDNLEARLLEIAEQHPRDFVVQRTLAIVYHRLRQLVDAANATDRAIESFGQTETRGRVAKSARAGLHHLRYRISSELGETSEASRSAKEVLADPTATDAMVHDALVGLASTDPEMLPDPEDLPALDGLDQDGLINLALRLSAAPPAAKIAAAIAEKAIVGRDGLFAPVNQHSQTLQIILIAGRHFSSAASIGEAAMESLSDDVPLHFNTAMAVWGRDGRPDASMFERVDKLIANYPGYADGGNPNAIQCHALALAVLGRHDDARRCANAAIASIGRAQRRELSCWTYLNVPPTEFEQHCHAIIAFADGGPGPVVIDGRS